MTALWVRPLVLSVAQQVVPRCASQAIFSFTSSDSDGGLQHDVGIFISAAEVVDAVNVISFTWWLLHFCGLHWEDLCFH